MWIKLFLEWLLDATSAGCLLTVSVLGLRFILRRRLNIHWYYGFWFILMFRLALPGLPLGVLDAYGNFGLFRKTAALAHRDSLSGKEKRFIAAVADFKDYALEAARKDRASVFFTVWLAGAAAFVFYAMHSNRRTARILKLRQPVRDEAVLRLFERCKRETGLGPSVGLMQAEALGSPLVYGVCKPVLVLPSGLKDRANEEQLRHVFLHELCHVRRKDIAVNLMSFLLQGLHWFNPLVAYAFHLMRQDREAACDSAVLSRLKPGERVSYGLTILALAGSPAAPSPAAAATSFSGKSSLKRRLLLLSRQGKKSRLKQLAGAALFLVLSCVAFARPSSAVSDRGFSGRIDGSVTEKDLSAVFDGHSGCFVLYNRESGVYTVFNKEESRLRVSPDSTFKIVSALVGLESGLVADLDTEIPWDGTVYPFPEWNENQTLRSAMVRSVNWFYEELNRRIGAAGMKTVLKDIAYGNADVSGGAGDFWNESSLKISPLEQVEFLRKFYGGLLPFSRRSVDLVKEAITVSASNGAVLAGKTGTGEAGSRVVRGWFVGCLKRGEREYYFATHLRGESGVSGRKAREITLRLLEAEGVLEEI